MMTCFKIIKIFGIFLMLLSIGIAETKGNEMEMEYNGEIKNAENIELIHQRIGYDINLKCGLGEIRKEILMDGVKIHWYFKQCGDSFDQKSCVEVYDDDWIHLPCEESFCKSTLHLKNLTDYYSGLYKCTLYPIKVDDAVTLDIRLVRTYQLHVKNSTVAAPTFLGASPESKNSTLGSQVVFQCRVQSLAHPTIKWFKQVQEITDDVEFSLGTDNFNSRIVQYEDRTYELLETAREKSLSKDTYLSKLILNDIGKDDEGLYACVAINYQGHSIREARLQLDMLGNEFGYERYAEERTDPMEFLLLFLMPVGLAAIPLAFWLCYVLNKRWTARRQGGCADEEKSFR